MERLEGAQQQTNIFIYIIYICINVVYKNKYSLIPKSQVIYMEDGTNVY